MPTELKANSPKIHVIDDDAMFCTAIARLLNALGYEVVIYESAEQLFQAALDSEPGCILSDVRMPGLSGLQLRARLADLGSTLPVIFLTGDADVLTGPLALDPEDVLLKPVSRATLTAALQRALKGQ